MPTSDCVFVLLAFQGTSTGHHEKHPEDIVVSNQQGAVHHVHHVILDSHRALHSLQWPLVSDSWTWGEVKFIMATLNSNRGCNPFIRWNYLFYYTYSSNFHAYRDLSKQSLNRFSSRSKRHFYSSETKLFYLDHLAFPNLQVVPLSISHTTRVTQTTNIGLKNAFTSTFGTRRLRAVISYQSELFVPFSQKLEYVIKKSFICRYLSFRDEGIQMILLLGCRFCGWFTSSYCFCFVLSWKRRESNVVRGWYQWDFS